MQVVETHGLPGPVAHVEDTIGRRKVDRGAVLGDRQVSDRHPVGDVSIHPELDVAECNFKF
jgi:hypothetical protein